MKTRTAVNAQAGWWPGIMADVAAAVARRSAAVSGDVYGVILREVPQLRDDTPVLALLASSVGSNVDTCLQIMQHRIDLAAVRAPAAATEYARRLAQRGTPLTALLRAYRLGHARFSDWMLRELAQQAGDAYLISAAALGMSGIVAGYIDQVSEEMVAAYTRERENWLLNRSATRAARIRHLPAVHLGGDHRHQAIQRRARGGDAVQAGALVRGEPELRVGESLGDPRQLGVVVSVVHP